MKKIHRKYCIALALLNIFALLKVTLVPNLQHTALYRPLKDGITALGWVLVAYMGYWYLERRRWEKASPEERRDMERSGQDERNQFLWGQAAYFSWQITLAAIAAMAGQCRCWTARRGSWPRRSCLGCMCCPISSSCPG